MSSFIPTATHFNSVERSLKLFSYSRDSQFIPYSIYKSIYPQLERSNTMDTIDECIESIVDTLRQLTAICVTLQYAHHYDGKLDEQIKAETDELMEHKKESRDLTKLGLLKAMQCINYQIEVEHLTELRQLTQAEQNALKFLRLMTDDITSDIVHNLPEYKTEKYSL